MLPCLSNFHRSPISPSPRLMAWPLQMPQLSESLQHQHPAPSKAYLEVLSQEGILYKGLHPNLHGRERG